MSESNGRRGPGRPTVPVWNEETEAIVLETLEAVGGHLDLAARAAKMAPSTLDLRIQRDEEFAKRVNEARAGGVTAALRQIRSAANNRQREDVPGDWKAAEAWLKLVDPDRFAARVEVTPEKIAQIREEALREFVAILDAAGVAPDVRHSVAAHIVQLRAGRVGGPGVGGGPGGRKELAG
jgi:hypothetical protein